MRRDNTPPDAGEEGGQASPEHGVVVIEGEGDRRRELSESRGEPPQDGGVSPPTLDAGDASSPVADEPPAHRTGATENKEPGLEAIRRQARDEMVEDVFRSADL
jgi:hypothetical protein